jgi:SHS2 domain-containing protein
MYELMEHTADVKAAFRATDLTDLYASAVDMLRDLLVGASVVRSSRRVVVPPEGDDPGERFFRFVRELVYLCDADGFIPGGLVSMAPPTVAGETFDPARHVFHHAVKAVTRHDWAFACAEDGCTAQMVLDL